LLEPRAIAAAIFVTSLILGGTLWRLGATHREARSAHEWAMASACAGVGLLLNTPQTLIAPELCLLVGKLLMLLGMGLTAVGLQRTTQQPLWARPLVAGEMALLLILTQLVDNNGSGATIHTLVFCALMVITTGVGLTTVQLLTGKTLSGARWFLTLSLLLLVLVFGLRATAQLLALVGAPQLSASSLWSISIYLVGGAALIALQTGGILLLQLQLVDDVREASERDTLTGLLNRRGLAASMPKSLEGLSLLAIDVDHFKRLNDTHGHAAGDSSLAFLGAHLNRQLREHDLAARMGGEEFAVLLSGVNSFEALRIAQRIRADLARTSGAATGHAITVSMGVATAQAGETFDALWSRADAALYVAKHQGRNRCEVAPQRKRVVPT
jgi:diguanylate cyclase (GGDEF)-like protein